MCPRLPSSQAKTDQILLESINLEKMASPVIATNYCNVTVTLITLAPVCFVMTST